MEQQQQHHVFKRMPHGSKPQWREGLCNKNANKSPCCRPVKPGKRLCEHHWEQDRRNKADRMKRTLAKGLCTNCHKRPTVEGFMNCKHCRDMRNAAYHSMTIAERRALREKYSGRNAASPRTVGRERHNEKLLHAARDEQARTGEKLSVILKRMGASRRQYERWERREAKRGQ